MTAAATTSGRRGGRIRPRTGAPSSTSTATTVCPRLRRSINANANSVSSKVENATTIAPGRNRRARGQRSRCGLEAAVDGEHRVEHPIELPAADVGAEPARVAIAERDDAGPVTASQRALHDLYGAPHGSVGGLGRRTGGLRIVVDEHHHVGGAVGQPFGDMQAAPARAHRPVDRAKLIAGHVSTDVGVLDAGPDVPGEVGAEAVEQIGPRNRRRLRRSDRKHVDVGGVDHARRPRASRPRAPTVTWP